jgi:hypothetical protein
VAGIGVGGGLIVRLVQPLLRPGSSVEDGTLAMVLATRIDPLLVRVADTPPHKGVDSR